MTPDQIEYLKNWLFRANEDIQVIKYLSKTELESYLSTICMHTQQAVEKFLKAFLVYHNIDFPRTHDVDFLLKQCQKIDKNDFNIDLGSLSIYGLKLRYPDDFYIPDKSETIQNIDTAQKIKNIVESKIKL